MMIQINGSYNYIKCDPNNLWSRPELIKPDRVPDFEYSYSYKDDEAVVIYYRY